MTYTVAEHFRATAVHIRSGGQPRWGEIEQYVEKVAFEMLDAIGKEKTTILERLCIAFALFHQEYRPLPLSVEEAKQVAAKIDLMAVQIGIAKSQILPFLKGKRMLRLPGPYRLLKALYERREATYENLHVGTEWQDMWDVRRQLGAFKAAGFVEMNSKTKRYSVTASGKRELRAIMALHRQKGLNTRPRP
ncbi:MAG: hypothetical protein UY36_C0009G0003 [Parcubacteria group bacterium GW2011_GWA1_49_11]|uniref:Uncharacterized protein n=1 Tax=Candidatus Yanofskybacteria bacterium RIFCSPHIGHO2_01_FULL_48_25b TaxID=1802672 RepID=A0A1F8F221_9BACT|nr:MAG: hypothetical protein UY36_C0009G0003 [Parcubacteria group bacterium GW2011_GWA1_49_11]OGN07187.1 MAG: hypothetical protein A2669_00390 [Candidatus Yanofskybacteria bacterium RIFCSPHIGHO2_01_FULL_48_25b]